MEYIKICNIIGKRGNLLKYNFQVKCFSKLSHIKKVVPQNERLTHRFLEYFQKCNKNNNVSTSDIVQLHNHRPSSSGDRKAMFEIDRKLCSSASVMENNDILKYITFYMLTTPKEVTQYEFYNMSKSILSHRIDQLTPQQLVQFMYIVALKKKSYDSKMFMKKCLLFLTNDKLEVLTVDDVLVICNATFKSSSTIYNKELLRLLQKTLYSNLHLLNDPPMFITLIKAIRLNQCQNDEMLNTISATIFFNSTYKLYNFAALCHILALYVDYLYYDEVLLKLFADLALNQLKTLETKDKKSYFGDNIRAKDIQRFLWAYSYIGYNKLHKEDLQLIEKKIIERLDAGYYDDNPGFLLDSAFYLWMLKHQALNLLAHCKSKIAIVRKNKSKSKIRVNMLLICMQLENMQLYKEFNCKAEPFKLEIKVKDHVAKRPLLSQVFDALKSFMGDFDVNRLEYEYQIPHINIIGITGYKKNIYKIFILEMLDDTTRVKNVPKRGSGPMQLKIRLLRNLGHPVILIDSADIEELNAEKLKEFLHNELTIVL